MYYQLTIEANTPEGILEGLDEARTCIYKKNKMQQGAMRPRYAFAYKRKKSVKKTYYYIDWDNYMGRGSVKATKLSRDEYIRLKGWGGNKDTIKGLPPIWPYKTKQEAENALDAKYND